MGKSENRILKYLSDKCKEQKSSGKSSDVGCSTREIADDLCLQRTNVSSLLNRLCDDGKIFKIKGKPIIYYVNLTSSFQDDKAKPSINGSNFSNLIGGNKSLKKSIQQAQAAILYPPRGLHTLILGPTGVGKTMFAELMYKFATEKEVISRDAPFISFNCADYSNNPQLIMAHLFGSKKGAFTGADKDRIGLVDKSNGGILFLDEIHRLPAEGQEMLFMLIDKSVYTPLGNMEEKKSGKVLIICATTEEADSALLTTFTRRIPMTINIPALKDRTIDERFELICDFFKIESRRIAKEITISTNTVRGLLLYNCRGNIGQLKSDIQLGCANAFLKFVSKGKNKIEVHSTDFSNNVRQGLVSYMQESQVVDKIIEKDRRLNFKPMGIKFQVEPSSDLLPDNFYESIEQRIQELKDRGVDEDDINFTMSFDIKNYFNKYIEKFEQEINKDELSKIVDEHIIVVVEEFFKIASEQLKKIFPTKVFYGLCLHISSIIERIHHGKEIINHNLNEIIQKHGQEYGLAINLSNKVEKKFDIKIPADEVGFIAMFLCVDETSDDNIGKPIIVIAMHGRSTASSMAEVANKLVGGNNVYAYDMNLDKNTQIAYKELKEFIIANHQGPGVILLVDMGSLGMFGELISEETGIKIRVIEMVSTLIAIECARKALTNNNIHEVWEESKQSVAFLNNYNMSLTETYIPSKDNIIITTCVTGEGSAVKIKNMIESAINLIERDIQVVAIAASDKKETFNTINTLSKNKKVIAIVGAINPNVYDIPFIPISELFLDNNYARLREIVSTIKTPADVYNEIFDSLEKEITELNIREFQPLCIKFLDALGENVIKYLDIYKVSGLTMHLACALVRLINKDDTPKCSKKEEIKGNYLKEFNIIKTLLRPMEEFYNIKFSDDEVCHIAIIILEI